MVYWVRCLSGPNCGKGAEALTLRIMAALYAREEGAPLRQTVSAASAAAHGAILEHVAALDLPPPAALDLTKTLDTCIGTAIRQYADLTAEVIEAAEMAESTKVH